MPSDKINVIDSEIIWHNFSAYLSLHTDKKFTGYQHTTRKKISSESIKGDSKKKKKEEALRSLQLIKIEFINS